MPRPRKCKNGSVLSAEKIGVGRRKNGSPRLTLRHLIRATADIYRRIVSGKLFMDENFHEALDLSSISRHACLSKSHFHRLFTKVYGTTPHQYLTRRRINAARSLLSGQQLSISEICASIGFQSTGSFSVLFKKECGFTPSYYRNLAWKRRQQANERPLSQVPGCFVTKLRLHATGCECKKQFSRSNA